MEGLPGVQADYLVGRTSWQVTIRDRKDVGWAILAVEGYHGETDIPLPFYFAAGWDELVLQAAVGLARICGPLVLLPESGASPKIVR